MNKAKYDINGIAQKEANKLVSSGVSPTRIIPNQEEFWIYWYTFEDQIKTELTKTNGDKNLAKIPPIPGDITYVKNSYGNDSMYLNEFLVIQKSDIGKIPKSFSYRILKIINVQSLFVNTQLYLIKIDNFYSAM